MHSNDFKKLMWLEACELLSQAERLHRQFFHPGGAGEAVCTWEPPVDLIESGNTLTIYIALPGVTPEQVKVYFEPGYVTITGLRRLSEISRDARFRRLEIPYGEFLRRIQLPHSGYEIYSSEMVHGCLQLVLREVSA